MGAATWASTPVGLFSYQCPSVKSVVRSPLRGGRPGLQPRLASSPISAHRCNQWSNLFFGLGEEGSTTDYTDCTDGRQEGSRGDRGIGFRFSVFGGRVRTEQAVAGIGRRASTTSRARDPATAHRTAAAEPGPRSPEGTPLSVLHLGRNSNFKDPTLGLQLSMPPRASSRRPDLTGGHPVADRARRITEKRRFDTPPHPTFDTPALTPYPSPLDPELLSRSQEQDTGALLLEDP